MVHCGRGSIDHPPACNRQVEQWQWQFFEQPAQPTALPIHLSEVALVASLRARWKINQTMQMRNQMHMYYHLKCYHRTIPLLTMPKGIQKLSLVSWPQDAGGGPELWESRSATPLELIASSCPPPPRTSDILGKRRVGHHTNSYSIMYLRILEGGGLGMLSLRLGMKPRLPISFDQFIGHWGCSACSV